METQSDIFVSLLYQQQVANITPWLDDIILGDQFAPFTNYGSMQSILPPMCNSTYTIGSFV